MCKISEELYSVCQICGKNIKEIKKEAGGSGVYISNAFKNHVENNHCYTIESYFDNFGSKQPICPCGICGKKLRITTKRNNISGMYWKEYACGRNPGLLKWSKQAQKDRCGANNPMFNKKPWNKNKTKNDDESVKKISEKRMGIVFSEETKKKMSKAAKARLVHGNTGKKHSEASKRKMAQRTIENIKKGVFKHTKTKPHLEMLKILTQNMGLKVEEEKKVEIWSFDFFLPDYNVYIEVDGDYFHSNPKMYPYGPKTKTQKINFYRDNVKNKYCEQTGIELIRFWESDILNDQELIEERIWASLRR
jgi:very-short-patch-repair endonuclease